MPKMTFSRNRMARGAKRRTRPRAAALAATPDKMLPFVRALAGDVETHLNRGLGQPVTQDTLLAAARASHQYYEQTWDYIQSLNIVQHACHAGCAHCCFLTVEASGPEVLLIADHLRAVCCPERLAEITERLRRTAAAVSGLTPTERVRAAVPCGLLEGGRCQAYAVRPLGCRAWNSRDAGACANVLRDGGGDLRPVQDQRPGSIEMGIRTGFAAALRQADLPEDADRRCELNTALQIALDDPQAAERWIGGDDALAPSRAAVYYGDKDAAA